MSPDVAECTKDWYIENKTQKKMLIGFQSSGKDQSAVVLDSVFCTLIS